MVGNRILSLLSTLHLLSFAGDQQNIQAQTGDRVTLPCWTPSNNISTVKWTTPTLEESGKEEYVFLHRDGHIPPRNQHQDFLSRVQLVDSEMKDGNLSICLENVTVIDTGVYMCKYIDIKGESGNCTVFLEVKDSEDCVKKVMIIVAAVLIVGFGIVWVCKYKKHKGQHTDLESASVDNSLNKGVCSKLLAWKRKQCKKPESGPNDPEKANLNTDSSDDAAGVFP